MQISELVELKKSIHEESWKPAYKFIPELIQKFNLKVGAEIGVAFGGHSEAILSNTNLELLYGIDSYQHCDSYDDPMNLPQADFDILCETTKNRLAVFGDRFRLIRSNSQQAIGQIDGLLDFVYIDAEHSYQGVWQDLCTWYSKIRVGGLISGHDYGHIAFPGVKQAIDEFFRRLDWQVHLEGEGVWWVEKQPTNISFFIPAYNCEQTIEESVDSILNGNFEQGDELIIVNDCSADNTTGILECLKIKYPFINIFRHETNKGGGAARNTAVQNASHPLLFCLDSDNILVPGSIQKLKEFLVNSGADVAAFQEIHFFEGRKQNIINKWIYQDQITLADFFSRHDVPGASGNYLFTKESWVRGGGYSESSGALDTHTFGFRQLATGSKMLTLPNTYYCHRQGIESYLVRFSRSNNWSLILADSITPFAHLIAEADWQYMCGEGKDNWYGNITQRPISLRTGIESMQAVEAQPKIVEPQPIIIPYWIEDHISSTSSHLLPGESQVVAQYIKAGDIILDLGANIGEWAKEVLTRHEDVAEMHIFEPLAHVHKNLLDSLRGENNVKILAQNMAAGSREEIKTFYQYDDHSTLGTFDRSCWIESQGWIQPPQGCTVFTTTVDRYCQRLGIKRINFLKIDVEGSELDVLYGASELLKYGKIDYIQFEYGTTYREANITLKEVCEYLQKYRYSIFKILPQGLEYRPNFQPEYEVFEGSNFLAVNERFRANVLGEPPRLLDVPQLCAQHSVTPKGIIHVGAHEGSEIGYYQAMGAQKILFVEANPAVFERLQANLAGYPNAQAVNCAISDRNGTTNLHVTSYDQSSSILPLKHHQDIYPDIVETHQVTVPSKTLDTLLQELELNPADFNILNIDIQGAELLALQGATNWLQYVDAINTEVNYEELYEGCAIVHDLDEFLDRHGFERVATTTPHPSWGDGFYVKKPLVTMSILSRARFGNQIFLYAMLKIHEQQQNVRVETSAWIGQYLFGHSEPPISKSLPVVHDSGLGIINAEAPFRNVEFGGPTYQIPTKYYAQHKELFRSLFQPMPEVEAKVAAAVSSLRQRGKTIVGLHLRRGDYWGPYAEFMFIAPNSCYKKWLQGLWETLEEPVLFIASDELEEVVDDFADYHPVTVKDLGVEMPEAPFYPDFYILSQCDVLAISNSTFSVAASMLNERCKFFFRPHLPSKTLIPFDPWDSEPLYWHGSGTWEEDESGYGLVTTNQSLEKESNPLRLKIAAVVDVAPAYPEALEWLQAFNIDSPAIGKVDNSEILMSGWVLGKSDRAVAVEFIYNGETVCTTPVGGYRSDVASAFPGVPLAGRSAYKAKLEISGKQPESDVLIQAILADETCVKLGLVRLQEVVYQFPLGNQKQKYRMKWFFAINEASPGFDIYSQMIKVAVYTALQNTSLEPYCIYDGEDNELTDWLQKNGVKIIYHRTPHYEKLQTQHPLYSTVAFGAFLRIEIPKIVEIYEIPDEYVFYTDCDVMFFDDVVDYLQGITCEYFAATPEHDPNNWEHLNSGVLYMNVKNLQKIQKEFDDFIDKNLDQILQLAYDQGAYNLFFKDKWDRLDIQLNWKSYWDFSYEAKIIHFHGPKPTQAEEIRSKTAPASSMLFANGFYWLNTEIWQFTYEKIEELDAGILVKTAEGEQFDPQLEEAREELAQFQTKLEQNPGGFEQFTTRLEQVQEELQPIKQELESRRLQYQKTQEELEQTKSQLIEVQTQLQEMESAVAPLTQLAELYLAQGKLEDAIAVCEQVLKINPKFVPVYKTLGNVLQAQGKLDEARNWYIRALEIQPDFSEALANLGTIHAQQQQWQEAIAAYQKAIAIQPNFAGVYRNLAKVFSQIGKPDEAVECCYAAVILEPKTTAEEYFNLGNTLLEQGKQERAIVCYRRAVYLNPNLSEAHDKLSEVMSVVGE
ncbi:MULTISPECIES: FkbM family methyltransferase [unclassified Tychonema]|uniref:FkbM family methyltransferase n=1 Tax=unclassified Tychonema TaxID=2642144 RepID=UPI001D1421DE|nr:MULTISPECIES: FkbM family methyltransferase [unclassified Tychonema]